MKRIFIDNSLLRSLCADCSPGKLWDGFLDIGKACGLDIERQRISLQNDWELFLEFIGLGSVLRKLRLDTDFETIETLKLNLEASTTCDIAQINKLLDNVFTKSLSECRAIASIQPSNLIRKYNEQCRYCQGAGSKLLVPVVAGRYIECLISDPKNALDTLAKYLAWHRQFAHFNSALNQLSTKGRERWIWEIFQQLMATFYWIASEHKIQLPWFRLINATYLNTPLYDQNECTSEQRKRFEEYMSQYKLKGTEDLVDCSYIDAATIGAFEFIDGEIVQNPVVVFTKDGPGQVRSRLQISRNFLEQLTTKVEGWRITPSYGGEVICLEENNGILSYVEKISHCVSL